jgi:hypothetical protein
VEKIATNTQNRPRLSVNYLCELVLDTGHPIFADEAIMPSRNVRVSHPVKGRHVPEEWRTKTFLPHSGIEPQFLGIPSGSVVVIPITLSPCLQKAKVFM